MKKQVNVWVELTGNECEASEYIGWHDDSYVEAGATGGHPFKQPVAGAAAPRWHRAARLRWRALGLPDEDARHIVALFDAGYAAAYPAGYVPACPRVVYLGGITYEVAEPLPAPALPAPVQPEAMVPLAGRRYPADSTALYLENIPLASLVELQVFPRHQEFTSLWLQGVSLPKAEPLASFPGLQQLRIQSCGLVHPPDCRALPRLQVLGCNNNALTQIPNIDGLPDLRELDMSANRLTSLAGLASPTLQTLNAAENQLTQLPAGPLPSLQEFSLQHNVIADLTPISQFAQLHVLNLSNNPVQDITAVLALSQLQELHLAGAYLCHLPDLMGLPALHKLVLARNRFTALPPLRSQSLQWLDVSGNALTTLPALGELPALWSLDVSDNRLELLAGLDQLPSLQGLYLHGNPLKAMSRPTYEFLRRSPVERFGLTWEEELSLPRFVKKHGIQLV